MHKLKKIFAIKMEPIIIIIIININQLKKKPQIEK